MSFETKVSGVVHGGDVGSNTLLPWMLRDAIGMVGRRSSRTIMPRRLTTDHRRGVVPFVDAPTAMRDASAYSLRAAARAAFAAYTQALDGGETPRESIAAALSAWRRFRPRDGDSEAQEKVMSIVLAVLNLDESDRGILLE